MPITILGAGAWGTALAVSLAEPNRVVLWGRDAELTRDSAARRENFRYLPDIRLPDALEVSADFEHAVAHAARDGLLIAAVPVAGLRSLMALLKPYAPANIVWLCKGFEEQTRMLPHQVVRDVLGDYIPAGTLSGPSFAQEVARGLPCALTVATKSHDLRDLVVRAIHGGNIRVYSSEDIVGVEVGGAVKNILAIASGIADGLGLGMNARAALITRGLAEITRLGVALGGQPETFMGLAGMGDLILTCTGDLSRNRRVGLGLGQGKSLAEIVADLGHVAEGVRCAQAVRMLALERGVSMPITDAVAGVLFDGDPVEHMAARMLERDPREESE
ncbi:MAG: NAD(P)H-dependent glycerol-3-phosphate dehydrogenase [Oxalobacteraceae bacterium]